MAEHADLIVELSGEVVRTARVVQTAFAAGVPVVTLNSEFHVTLGSCFAGKGALTEVEGDQPGCLGAPISDYLLAAGTYAGVFIVAEHDAEQRPYLEYLKLGPGPDYVLPKHFHLCHLEMAKTILRIAGGGRVLLDNSVRPTCGVMAVAKHALSAGLAIARGIGSFDVRGCAVPLRDLHRFVPIGLLEDVSLIRPVGPEEPVSWEAVEGIDETAIALWRAMMKQTCAPSSAEAGEPGPSAGNEHRP